MTLEEHLKSLIGRLVIDLAVALAQRDAAQETLTRIQAEAKDGITTES